MTNHPGQQHPENNQNVARNDSDHQPGWEFPGNTKCNVDADDQQFVGEWVEVSPELCLHFQAFGQKSIDGVANPGANEREKRRLRVAADQKPEDHGHENDAAERDEVRKIEAQVVDRW